MTEVQSFFRSINKPFFIRRKFLIATGIIFGISLIVGLLWTWYNYNLASGTGKAIRWKKVADPMSLPAIVGMIYLVIVAIWFAVKLKELLYALLGGTTDLTEPSRVALGEDEEKLGEAEFTHRRSPGTSDIAGRLTITSHRLIHSPKFSVKRVRVLIGMNEPDVAFMIPLSEVRQCGFGLDPKDPYRFGLITFDGTLHSFYSAHSPIEKAMDKLAWKKMQVGETVYWIR